VTTTVTAPIAKSSTLAAGSVLEVLVDPKDRERLSIDWDGAHQRGTAEQVIMGSPAARAALEGLGLDPARVAREADEARRRALADCAPAATAEAHVPIWPSGIARFDGDVLEVTTGDGIRVAARDIVKIGVESPRDGRLTLRLSYQAGLDSAETSYWVAPQHETALQLLVDAVAIAKGTSVMWWELATDLLSPSTGPTSVERIVEKSTSGTLPVQAAALGAFARRLNESGWLADEVIAAGMLRQGTPPSPLALVTGMVLLQMARARRSTALPHEFTLAATAARVVAFAMSPWKEGDAVTDSGAVVRIKPGERGSWPRGPVQRIRGCGRLESAPAALPIGSTPPNTVARRPNPPSRFGSASAGRAANARRRTA
jgi:hypothetical protein